MKAKLSARVINQVKPSDKIYEVYDTEIKGFLLRVYPSGRMNFYYSYRNREKKRNRIMIGVLGSRVTVQQAREEAKDYATMVSKGIDVQGEKQKNTQEAIEFENKTLEHFLNEHYEDWVTTSQKSGKESVRCIRSYFKQYLSTPLHKISHSTINRWRIKKLNEGLKPSTINRRVTLLKGLMSRAVEWNYIPDHPLKQFKDLKVDKKPLMRYLSEDEHARLFGALAERDEELRQARERANHHRQDRNYDLLPSLYDCEFPDRLTPMVTLALKTGMRRGELFDLLWGDVNLDRKFVTIRGEVAKSNNTRHIPLGPTAFETLELWKEQSPNTEAFDRVFPADDGGRLDNVRKSWANLLARAQIENFRWHDMRHDFASQLVMKSVPLNTVRELCGHANMNTTLRYAHLAPDHKQDAVSQLG